MRGAGRERHVGSSHGSSHEVPAEIPCSGSISRSRCTVRRNLLRRDRAPTDSPAVSSYLKLLVLYYEREVGAGPRGEQLGHLGAHAGGRHLDQLGLACGPSTTRQGTACRGVRRPGRWT